MTFWSIHCVFSSLSMELGTTGLLVFCWFSHIIVYGFIILPLCRASVQWPILSLETVSTKQKLTSLINDTKFNFFLVCYLPTALPNSFPGECCLLMLDSSIYIAWGFFPGGLTSKVAVTWFFGRLYFPDILQDPQLLGMLFWSPPHLFLFMFCF